MKILFLFAAVLVTGFVVSSCSNDEVNQNLFATRNYDTDALLLSKFVSIDKREGEYYINSSKKITALSYITDQDWLELQKVNPVNRVMYENELKTLNSQLALAAARDDVSQIVYSTADETWVRNIHDELSVNIVKGDLLETRMATTKVGSFSFRGNGFLESTNFSAGSRIRSDIQLSNVGDKYYFVEIDCAGNIGQETKEEGSSPNSVILSGTAQYFIYNDLIWTTTGQEENILWEFKGKMLAPAKNQNAYVKLEFVNE